MMSDRCLCGSHTSVTAISLKKLKIPWSAPVNLLWYPQGALTHSLETVILEEEEGFFLFFFKVISMPSVEIGLKTLG